jgi:hypothetical protein
VCAAAVFACASCDSPGAKPLDAGSPGNDATMGGDDGGTGLTSPDGGPVLGSDGGPVLAPDGEAPADADGAPGDDGPTGSGDDGGPADADVDDGFDGSCPVGSLMCGDACAAFDPQNCGACGHDCLGGGCGGGLCQPVALYDQGYQAAGIAVDATNVYWADFNGGTIMQAPLDGSSPALVLATGQAQPLGVAVDGAYVYWANFIDAHVRKVPIGGGDVVDIASGIAGASYVAVNADAVFWTGYGDGGIYSAPLDGGPPAAIVTGQTKANDIVLDSTRVYWTTEGSTVMASAFDGTNVTTLASGITFPYGIAVNGSRVFWTNQVKGSGNVGSAPLTGDGGAVIIAQNQDLATGIATDTSGAYWANGGTPGLSNGSIGYSPLDGGRAVVVTNGQDQPHSIALDARFVYFTSFGSGHVLRVAK